MVYQWCADNGGGANGADGKEKGKKLTLASMRSKMISRGKRNEAMGSRAYADYGRRWQGESSG